MTTNQTSNQPNLDPLDIDELTFPPGIHATVLTGTVAATGGTTAHLVVWAERLRRCPGCDQPGPDNRGCPVTLNSDGQPWEWSHEHGCGAWWGCEWGALDVVDGVTVAEAQTLIDRVGWLAVVEADSARDTLLQHLGDQLTDQIALFDGLVGDGVDADEAERQATTGSETAPGVFRDGGRWVAWDHDPVVDGGIIEVWEDQ